MWSHSIADASIGSGEGVAFQNQICRACDRSSSSADVRHVITLNGVYVLPIARNNRYLGGWEVAGIASARTGLPVNIAVSRTAAALPDGNTSSQRPNLVPGVPIYAADQTINNWFNIAAFSAPANGTWESGALYRQRAGSLRNRFLPAEAVPAHREAGANFRAAAFNLLNHPNTRRLARA
jgi:hypothetical protein